MEYIELTIENVPGEQMEILVCLLSEEGFESFAEKADALLAYIPSREYKEQIIEELIEKFHVQSASKIIPEQNWNEVWEKEYDPVMIKDQCFIHAPFHPSRSDVRYDIVIEPKMSFGTAHHETTALMIELMLDTGFAGKKVIDMGCGTGVLAILAAKAGAVSIVAIDNDEWSYQNALENTEKNNFPGISVVLGDVNNLQEYEAVLKSFK